MTGTVNRQTLHGKAKAHARLRHKIAVAVYYMLKHDKVFDMNRFLGIKKDRTENPEQQWTETSGQQSEPILNTENLSGIYKTKGDKNDLNK